MDGPVVQPVLELPPGLYPASSVRKMQREPMALMGQGAAGTRPAPQPLFGCLSNCPKKAACPLQSQAQPHPRPWQVTGDPALRAPGLPAV